MPWQNIPHGLFVDLFLQQPHHDLSRIVGSYFVAEPPAHFGISINHAAATSSVGQQTRQFSGNVIHRKCVGNKLPDHLTVGNEIDKRNVFHLQQMLTEKGDDLWYRSFVAHHLRHVEQSRLKSGRSAGDNSRTRMGEQFVSLPVDYFTGCPDMNPA